jgi:hypothetical protein
VYRGYNAEAELGGLHIHHCFGELLNGVNSSVSDDDCDNGELSLLKYRPRPLKLPRTAVGAKQTTGGDYERIDLARIFELDSVDR